jgi:hypothetical protein
MEMLTPLFIQFNDVLVIELWLGPPTNFFNSVYLSEIIVSMN